MESAQSLHVGVSQSVSKPNILAKEGKGKRSKEEGNIHTENGSDREMSTAEVNERPALFSPSVKEDSQRPLLHALHHLTYYNVAVALSTVSGRAHLYEYVEKCCLSEEHNQNKIYTNMGKGGIILGLPSNGVSHGVSHGSGSDSGGGDETDALAKYQAQWRVRRKLRHHVKVMVKENHPNSYYKDVDL